MSSAANTLGIVGALLVLSSVTMAAQEDAANVAFFEQRIRPLLVEHCYSCHSKEAKKLKGGLLLDSASGWKHGGDSGSPAIVPGDVDNSPLVKSVRYDDEDLQMPPKKKLSETQIADLVAWVKMGAPDPRTGTVVEAKRADKSWWSLQPLKKNAPPETPGIPEAWSRHPIDRYIFAQLAAKGLKPNPLAAARDIIRRLYYDVTGLPPTPAELKTWTAAYNADPTAAVAALVDQLLASPHYGEQWGRHWLDVVRFGESHGFERNLINDLAWPFRDYVINSINADKPFNQFIIEHLAGDVVGKNDPTVEIGTAFLVTGPYDDVGNADPVAKANIRANTVDDMVTATGNAFLGLTINCARCHHHKFDPMPTEDYYRVKAAFDGVTHGSRTLATLEQQQQHAAAIKPLQASMAKLQSQKEALEQRIVQRAIKEAATLTREPPSAQLTEETFPSVTARHVRLSMLASTQTAESGVGARIDEFEVWSAADPKANVALATVGAKAEGATGRVAEDFDGAYGVQRVNDGKYSERWFAGSPAVLTIHLAKEETINRVSFSHDRLAPSEKPISGQGPAVEEYTLEVSLDGTTWQQVANSFDRKPRTETLIKARALRNSPTTQERSELGQFTQQIAAANTAILHVTPLPVAWAGRFDKPKTKPVVFRGGDPMKPGDEIAPSSLAVLDRTAPAYTLPADAPESERRLALAKWIVSDENALTARVLANRVWHYHFGTGIVDTPSDFGFLGSLPTHPELLDWLAQRLQHHGWRLKALHREILTSQTYLQSADSRTDGARLDKDARLLWRFPPRRLSAEEIRDTMLQVSGSLDPRMGGLGFRLYQYKNDNVSTFVPLDKVGAETYRRAVYHQNARASVIDVLSDFDLPDTAFGAPKRAQTNSPLQALTLLNHSFTMDLADAMNQRILQEAGSNDAFVLVRLAYELAFQRPPSESELSNAAALVQQHGLSALCRALLNANELIYLN